MHSGQTESFFLSLACPQPGHGAVVNPDFAIVFSKRVFTCAAGVTYSCDLVKAAPSSRPSNSNTIFMFVVFMSGAEFMY
jgi:hypothetical protein